MPFDVLTFFTICIHRYFLRQALPDHVAATESNFRHKSSSEAVRKRKKVQCDDDKEEAIELGGDAQSCGARSFDRREKGAVEKDAGVNEKREERSKVLSQSDLVHLYSIFIFH